MSKSIVSSKTSVTKRNKEIRAATCQPQCIRKEYQIPPLSIPQKPLVSEQTRDKFKRKVMRKNVPEGEDLQKIREIIQSLRGKSVIVEEFSALIAPYTGDNGAVLQQVMQSELATFRRMANHIYDTMSQDISDVLANEQKQMVDFYNEKYVDYTERMMRAIDTIYSYCPNFDFEEYYKDKETYFKTMFPMAQEVELDVEEEALQKRQAGYHRLQWLRTEGERLQDENTKLQERLKQLKRQQKHELILAQQQERAAEQQRQELETTQTELQNQLANISDSMEKSIIIASSEEPKYESTSMVQMKKSAKLKESKSRVRRNVWGVKAAKEIDEKFDEDAERAEMRIARQTQRRQPIETSPFHYSPPRSPSPLSPQMSPFHYSPVQPPPEFAAVSSSPQRQSVDANDYSCRPGRARAPKDTWGGFY